MFDQMELQVIKPSPSSIHVAPSTRYQHWYIWSSYPSPKPAKIDYSALFSFDLPSAILFSFSLVGAVALMKLFTYFGSKLGLDTVSEEPVNIPTRYLVEQLLIFKMIKINLESRFLMLKMLKGCFLLDLPLDSSFFFILYLAYLLCNALKHTASN